MNPHYLSHTQKIKVKSNSNEIIKTIYDYKTDNKDLTIDEENSLLTVQKYDKPELSRLDEKGRNLIFEIFEIIEKNLDVENAEKIKQIIVEHYS